eukprot:TRINITY_DN7233_c0_g1_i1.p1 TRINITY_DN7233_c0_g1~~TRINITY_DN7233_c0_g1_i1.p1  ORF type:complete len:577 (+),score=251.19 TRINITY_DN7233_c0_g1_i1:96-1826(+)
MCGIICVLGLEQGSVESTRRRLLTLAQRIRHRGPDASGIFSSEEKCFVLAHERLSIMDPDSGDQPLFLEEQGERVSALAVNGEIYNHKELEKGLGDSVTFKTGSDCECILPLAQKYGEDCVNMLEGMFAFVHVDMKTGEFFAVRDHIGVIPLYMGYGKDGSIWFASELKALKDDCHRFLEFPPGHIYSSVSGDLRQWYQPKWHDEEYVPSEELPLDKLREGFEESVGKMMMSDVPWGVLLSGGLDSSLVASVAVKLLKRRREEMSLAGEAPEWWPKVHSFSVGLEGSPDLAAAKKVSDFIGTIHHAYTFTVQEGIDALSDVIAKLETYDVTTCRAATPMYIMSRKIRAMGVKMVLSGEGADEAMAGYLYFHKAPDAAELHKECVRKLKDLHLFDCLRANKSTAAWGVEARVPFLDKKFLELMMEMDPTQKLSSTHPDGARMEKHALRAAFDDKEEPYLPEEVLWRQKEQFSDGVGYSWIDSLKEFAEKEISDKMFKAASFRFPINTPMTKEAYLIRQIFEEHYPQQSAVECVPQGPSVACSTAKAIEWDAQFKAMAEATNGECSGRAVGVHVAAYE